MDKQYDVIVAGAGSSGMCAALASARQGMRTLLIEQNGFLGGTNTACLVNPMMGFHAGSRQVVWGIAQEVIDELAACKGTIGHIPDPIGVTGSITPIEPETLKQVWFRLAVKEPMLTILLHSIICEAECKDNRLKSVTVNNKSGKTTFTADVFIDATGDADLSVMAKVKFTSGRPLDGFAQPMTAIFKVGNVDFSQVRTYMKRFPEQFVLSSDAMEQDYVAVSGFFDIVDTARQNGDLSVERDRVLLFQGVEPDEAIVNMSRVIRLSGTNAEDLTFAEIQGRAQIDEIVCFLRKYIPGFKEARLIETGSSIGVRETRHLEGLYQLTEQDILANARFPDSIAVCAFPIDIHDPLGTKLHWARTAEPVCYDVPYRAMLPQKTENLLVTGRAISATHEAAASVRITPTAMATGEAAGIAASMAVRSRCPVSGIDIGKLQHLLVQAGAIPGQAFLRSEGDE